MQVHQTRSILTRVIESEGIIFLRALHVAALPENGVEAVELSGWSMVVARVEGQVQAAINRCSHAAAAFVPGGRVRRGVLMCPAHGARFAMQDGRCIGGLYRPLRTFTCREVDGWIEIEVPEEAPGPDERPVAR